MTPDSARETPDSARETPAPATTHTVEEVVRKQLSQALGGGRGMLEAAVPTIAFTVIFLTVHDLRLAIIVSVACAGVSRPASVSSVRSAVRGMRVWPGTATQRGHESGKVLDTRLGSTHGSCR